MKAQQLALKICNEITFVRNMETEDTNESVDCTVCENTC